MDLCTQTNRYDDLQLSHQSQFPLLLILRLDEAGVLVIVVEGTIDSSCTAHDRPDLERLETRIDGCCGMSRVHGHRQHDEMRISMMS